MAGFNYQVWYSRNPRVVLPKHLVEKLQTVALREKLTTNPKATPRSVLETALESYLLDIRTARANGQRLAIDKISIPSGSPGVRIDDTLWQRLATEAELQVRERNLRLSVNHLAGAALQTYLSQRENSQLK